MERFNNWVSTWVNSELGFNIFVLLIAVCAFLIVIMGTAWVLTQIMMDLTGGGC